MAKIDTAALVIELGELRENPPILDDAVKMMTLHGVREIWRLAVGRAILAVQRIERFQETLDTATTYVERRAYMVKPGDLIETRKGDPVSRVIVDKVIEENSAILKFLVKVPFVRELYLLRNETVWQII